MYCGRARRRSAEKDEEEVHVAGAPEQVAPGVYRVDTTGIPVVISVLLVADDDGWMLVCAAARYESRRH